MYGRCERPFFMWSCTRSRKTIDTLKHMERGRMIQCMLELLKFAIYKNACARSINVVMATLWKNAYNTTCWKMFQHNNKYMIIIWVKPLTGRRGGSCIRLIFNPESAQGMDQISIDPPIFQKFFGFWGTAWGV